MVVIPYQQLATDTLQSLLEEYATRDGTDYGDLEKSLQQKVDQLNAQLLRKDILIVYDLAAETANILTRQQFAEVSKLSEQAAE